MRIEDVGELKIKTQARALLVSRHDNMAMLLGCVEAGEIIELVGTLLRTDFIATQNVPTGFQIAVTRIEAGKPLVKSGQVVGIAATVIEPGQVVYPHNYKVA